MNDFYNHQVLNSSRKIKIINTPAVYVKHRTDLYVNNDKAFKGVLFLVKLKTLDVQLYSYCYSGHSQVLFQVFTSITEQLNNKVFSRAPLVVAFYFSMIS